MLDFLEFKYANKAGKTKEVMRELPQAIRYQMVKHRFSPCLEKVQFFKGADEAALVAVGELTVPTLVSPNDFLIEKGQESDKLMILTKGTASIGTKGEEGYQELGVGSVRRGSAPHLLARSH